MISNHYGKAAIPLGLNFGIFGESSFQDGPITGRLTAGTV